MRTTHLEFAGECAAIAERLRARVSFERHNLLTPRWRGGFDVILCRNVLIYFDAPARLAALARLHASLLPGGYLFLGYSETLRDVEPLFESLHASDGVVYRKRENEPQRPAPPSPSRPLASAPSASAAPPATRGTPAARAHSSPTGTSSKPGTSTTHRGSASHAASASRGASASGDAPTLKGSAAPTGCVRLRGDYHDGERLTDELRTIVDGSCALVDLDGATFLGEEAARILQRARTAAPALKIVGTRPAIVRWMARHGLLSRGSNEGAHE
jgi:hypothetical protein